MHVKEICLKKSKTIRYINCLNSNPVRINRVRKSKTGDQKLEIAEAGAVDFNLKFKLPAIHIQKYVR